VNVQNNTITLILTNLVNNTIHKNNVSLEGITGNVTFSYYNIGNTGFCASYTGAASGSVCTATDNATSTYMNTTTVVNLTGTQTVNTSVYQGLLFIDAYKLFVNTSITDAYNVTNWLYKNTSTSTKLLPVNNGTNNVQIDVPGNYTINTTCTVNSLTTSYCNATGVYDGKFTIGANNGTGLTSFTISLINETIHAYRIASTTTGNVTFNVLQGYHYTFIVNNTGYSRENATLPSNSSTNLYNITIGLIGNTFNLTFFNESTNVRITENVTVEITSETYSTNITAVDGNVSVLLPQIGEYTIRYWINPDVPRNYYYTLTSESYANINLYIIDEDISNLYLPVILSQNTVPLSNVTVQLLRNYIVSGNTNVYKVVEMAKTDTNGQAVLRVVPNFIDYILIITDGTHTLATSPTKFTASTNTYTLNTQGNPVRSLTTFPSVSRSFTFNNNTKIYTFTWTDNENIITEGCLVVVKLKNGVRSLMTNTCNSGSTGSVTYTVTDTNNTEYIGTATVHTNTEFSTLPAGTLSVSFATTYAVFGLVGFIIAALLFLTFTFVGGESGIAGMLISGLVSIVFLGAFGFLANTWTVTVGVGILVFAIIYKLRSG
jgi:hypothetical protein